LTRVRDRRIQYAYVGAVTGAGIIVVADSLRQMFLAPPGAEWVILAALTLFTGSFTIRVPSLPAKISVSETFVFTSVLLFGPAAGTVTVVLDTLVISFWMNRASRSMLRVLFNATAPAIAIRAASEAFFFTSGVSAGTIGRDDVSQLIAPAFGFALLYFFINTSLVAGALAAERSESPIRIWLNNFPSVGLTYCAGGSIALLLVAYTDTIDLRALSIIVPLLVVSYLTFRTSMGRLEDANRHVAQVQDLYLSTVETLAMAVDAKDQITHGHIRRVQVYATELAKRLGIQEEQQLRAVAAAALLHDMGKLAIPEHILNKPGKLTSAEFDKMKRHADIGADLLSSIRFPYPVVPIVRHHHENWDGSGYPSGVSGTDIPLGARVLSVVDCFDALTSDRPYRPRLSADEAFEIIRQRRGTMYDPLVVDTFERAYPEIAPAATKAGIEARSLTSEWGLTSVEPEVSPFEQIRVNAAESTLLIACAHEMSTVSSPVQALAVAAQCLRQLTPATVYALYRYEVSDDTLRCDRSSGDPDGLLGGLSIRMGERVTGWSAANRRSSLNSHATLDLAQIAERFAPPLRSTISSPLVVGEQLVGVLTAYSPKENPFVESDKYVVEHIAALLARTVTSATSRPTLVSFSRKIVNT
jgi:putative nucleotidyltransferase with HDIG domain